MATTGCPSGEVQTRLRLGQFDEALKAAATYQDIFGKENYFLEIMDHGLEIERRVRDGLLEIGRELDIPPRGHQRLALHLRVAGRARTTCCCACRPAATSPTRTGSGSTAAATTSSPPTRCARSTRPTLWQRGLPQHPAGRREGRPDRHVRRSTNLMPRFPVPDGRDRGDLVPQGGLRRAWTAASRTASDEEHRAAGRVRDRRHHPDGLPVLLPRGRRLHPCGRRTTASAVGPGRGSAAGSLVAYALGITDLDPIPHGLIFERFLNPERVSMPDVDIDFDERRRGDVIRYVTEQVGRGQGRPDRHLRHDQGEGRDQGLGPGARLPVRGRRPDHQGDAAGGDGQGHPARPASSTRAPALRRGRRDPRRCTSTDPDVKQGRSTPRRGLEGLIRQTGVHAAGVIMSAEPLIDHIPLMRRDADGAIITQFDYPTCETLGLLKMDFLGLRNLTIIDDAVKNIEAQPRPQARPAGAAAGRQGRPTSCWPAATRWACSSSTAGRCGRCCG